MPEKKLPCPECGGTMVLKASKYGPFYGCASWPACTCTHGARPDGSPHGIPGDKATRVARMAAHDLFDWLWKPEHGGTMSRGKSYWLLRTLMDMTKADAHIARFTTAECERLIARLSELNEPREEAEVIA